MTAPGTALVTGAARRIGRAIAIDLARAGWNVAVHYHSSADDAARVVAEIAGAGGRAVALAADLMQEAQTRALVGRAAAALGPVTCLVNNASVFENDVAETVTRETWDAHMETNLRAPFALMQDLAAALPPETSGNVINLIDERVWNLTPYFVSYTVSKAGLWALTQTMALALAPRIRVNAIGPGPTLPSPRQSPAQFERQWAAMPLRRGTTPAEICDAVRFILAAPAMTGQMIALDGGRHLGWTHPGATIEANEE
ncbi:MAG: SDR family oxidoreductase [Rhodospirillales bacterium]